MQDTSAHADNHVLEAKLANLRHELDSLSAQLHGKSGVRARLETYAGKTGSIIKAHPLASAAFALGLGYLVVRMVRR